jgi:hypothetical protein
MMNSDNGKTLLGESDIYINDANNFCGSSHYPISDLGNAGGVGTNEGPLLNNLAKQVAVNVGHLYQVFSYNTLMDFPSGAVAIRTGSSYYRFYVEAPILKDKETVGATVKYILVTASERRLPEDGTVVGTIYNVGEGVSYNLPKDAECGWDSDVSDNFDINFSDGKMDITLSAYDSPLNSYNIYVRLGSVYSCLVVKLDL